MVISQCTVGDADRTSVLIVQRGVISNADNSAVHIVVNLQSTNFLIQNSSNLANCSVLTNHTINREQHGNSLSIHFFVSRNQADKSFTNAQCIHIGSSNAQVTSANIGSQTPTHSSTVVDICNINIAILIKVGDGPHPEVATHTSRTNSVGEVDNSGAANVLSSSVQSSLQIIAVAHGNLNIGQIAQSGFKHCRLTSCRSSSRGGSRILGLLRSSVASGQHADGHDASQSQRSNLLEFHNDFFLLMVYKR